ncbi:MAG: amidase, partial [Gemmatimonadetes bacterium]|nr:amidase [Gemmatimonadota bacterium]
MVSDLCFSTVAELRELYASRRLSPVEAVQAILDHVETADPGINAFVTVTPELALRQARAAETAYARGHAGPLAGIPFTLKDLTPTRGIRTTRGSELYRDWVPDYDAPVAERLYAAGGVLLGKTNTPEMGWKGDTDNRVAGPTHNPWRRGRTAGGSSGGAAAAAAAGFGPLAQGSDGSGTKSIPACMCGVYA